MKVNPSTEELEALGLEIAAGNAAVGRPISIREAMDTAAKLHEALRVAFNDPHPQANFWQEAAAAVGQELTRPEASQVASDYDAWLKDMAVERSQPQSQMER